jgi:hypothetical protein
MFQTKDVQKIKTRFCSKNFSPENRVVYEINVEKYGTATQATGDKIIRGMRIASWITKVTGTYSDYVTRIAFYGRNDIAEACQCYVL